MQETHFLVVPPSEHQSSRPSLDDDRLTYRAWSILNEQTLGVSMQVGVIELRERGSKCPSHYHTSTQELQYILSGTGVVRDAHGHEFRVEPHTAIYCGSGPESAHEFENTGPYPLVILFVHPIVDGQSPDFLFADQASLTTSEHHP